MQARWLRLTVRDSRTPTTRTQKLSRRFCQDSRQTARLARDRRKIVWCFTVNSHNKWYPDLRLARALTEPSFGSRSTMPSGEPSGALRSVVAWFRGRSQAAGMPATESDWQRDERILREWTARTRASDVALHAAAFQSLVKV